MSLPSVARSDVDPFLAVRTVERGQDMIIVMAGELDMDTAPRLVDFITRNLNDRTSRLILDCAQVVFCGAAGVGALMRTQTAATAVAAWLVLLDPSPALRGALHSAQCADAFTVQTTDS